MYTIRGHTRSRITCEAMAAGIRAAGDKVSLIEQHRWTGTTDAEVAVFYGLEGNTPAIFEHYRTTPGLHACYIDLGYWGRRLGTERFTGYHKIVVDHRHPNAYLMRRDFPPDRFARFGVEVRDMQPILLGDPILLAGMGDKGAIAEGFEPEQWERMTIAQIRDYTDRPIVYRPKPSWKGARPIEGTIFSPATDKIEDALADCAVVVTHHSNVAVDALLLGHPAHVKGGAADLLKGWPLSDIERPSFPSTDARAQWAANLAYTQWSIAEMAAGLPWNHLKTEGLV